MGADEAIQGAITKLEALIAPIDGGVGEDLSYDEAFESVKAEIDKQNQIDGGSIDWKNVEELSGDLLSSRTKDFRIALYWAVARTQRSGYVGMFEGLVVLHELCKAFWDPMYPPMRRPRARGNLLSWYNELCTPIVNAAQPTPQERSIVEGLEKVFREVDSLLSEKLGEAYPPMMALVDAVRGLIRRAPAAPAPAAERPAPASVRAPASQDHPPADSFAATPADGVPAPGGVGVSVDIVDADSAYVALGQIAPLLAKASNALFNTDMSSLDGYRLGLQSAWILIGSDPYNQNGQTSLAAPSADLRQGLGALTGRGDWGGVVNTAWQAVMDNPFWLDAARALAQGLGKIIPPQDGARAVVEREAAALLARAPSLATLRFSDGSALADGETQKWIQGLASDGGGGGGAVAGASGDRSAIDRAAAEATKLASEGNLTQAMAVLGAAANTTSPVDRFRARLAIGKLALQQQIVDMARANLETLERTAEEHRLAVWDPALCAELHENLYRLRRIIANNGMDPEIGEKLNRTYERLCELDAARAYQVLAEG